MAEDVVAEDVVVEGVAVDEVVLEVDVVNRERSASWKAIVIGCAHIVI